MNVTIQPNRNITTSRANQQADEILFGLADPVWCRIAAFQFAPLVERLQLKEGLSLDQAQQAFDDAKQFLYLCGRRRPDGSQPMVPPEPIDMAWHHFILFTDAYTEFCDRHIGRYVHHRPFTQAERAANRADGAGLKGLKASIAFAKDVFGTLSDNWCEHLLTSKTGSTGGTVIEECSGSTNCQAPYR